MRSLHAHAAKTCNIQGLRHIKVNLGAKADPMRVRIADLGESNADRLTTHDAQFSRTCSREM